jgi:hypothetical protein
MKGKKVPVRILYAVGFALLFSVVFIGLFLKNVAVLLGLGLGGFAVVIVGLVIYLRRYEPVDWSDAYP